MLRPYRVRYRNADGSAGEMVRRAYSLQLAVKDTLRRRDRVAVLACAEISAAEYEAARAENGEALKRRLAAECRRAEERRRGVSGRPRVPGIAGPESPSHG
jgi:hypothetical protein